MSPADGYTAQTDRYTGPTDGYTAVKIVYKSPSTGDIAGTAWDVSLPTGYTARTLGYIAGTIWDKSPKPGDMSPEHSALYPTDRPAYPKAPHLSPPVSWVVLAGSRGYALTNPYTL